MTKLSKENQEWLDSINYKPNLTSDKVVFFEDVESKLIEMESTITQLQEQLKQAEINAIVKLIQSIDPVKVEASNICKVYLSNLKKGVIVRVLTRGIIEIRSKNAFGPDNLIMWEGRDHIVGFNAEINQMDLEMACASTAHRYKRDKSDVIYSQGIAEKVFTGCKGVENGGCCCTGACMTEVAEEFRIDHLYFENQNITEIER